MENLHTIMLVSKDIFIQYISEFVKKTVKPNLSNFSKNLIKLIFLFDHFLDNCAFQNNFLKNNYDLINWMAI